jgi:hypothetical protein
MRPCRSAYHTSCFRAGPPFTTRRQAGAGLQLPSISDWPNFICEACTVRRVTGRELLPADRLLLMLERMRLLDMIAYWGKNTHTTYQSKLRVIRRFEQQFDLDILRPTPLLRPPDGPDIPLMWCQEAYSLRPSTKRYDKDVALTLTFGTIRQLRSAASQYFAWDMMIAHPTSVVLTKERRLVGQPCRPTDGFSSTLHSRGMMARIGDDSKPSVALLDSQVRAFDAALNDSFLQARSSSGRREYALAGLANLTLWLGWLRTSECFGIAWPDCTLLHPDQGPEQDLPPGCGMVSFRLAPETKSDRVRRPDVVVAYQTTSGLHIGKWVYRARVHARRHIGLAHPLIFAHHDGSPWSSRYFRKAHLYPFLYQRQGLGDPYLTPFSGAKGNSIEEKFWSLHCYRRGARSHVSRGGKFGHHRFKKATHAQVYEHARWRYRRSSEAMDVIYREWNPVDRIKITLNCH